MSHKVSASYVRKANRMQSVEPWDRVGAVDKPRQEASCFIHGVWDLSVVNRCPQCPQPVAVVDVITSEQQAIADEADWQAMVKEKEKERRIANRKADR
jgi:hypothetical protein